MPAKIRGSLVWIGPQYSAADSIFHTVYIYINQLVRERGRVSEQVYAYMEISRVNARKNLQVFLSPVPTPFPVKLFPLAQCRAVSHFTV